MAKNMNLQTDLDEANTQIENGDKEITEKDKQIRGMRKILAR